MADPKITPTLKVLREIRDGMTEIRDEIRGTNRRLDAHVERLDGRLDALHAEAREGQLRTATELVAVADAVRGVHGVLTDRRIDRRRIDDHEERLSALEEKVG